MSIDNTTASTSMRPNTAPSNALIRAGKYRLIAEIARGGMGVVYLAVSTGPGGFSKLLVVKELRAELSDDPAFREMFLEEARLAARLSHPNVVQTYEVAEESGRHFLVMDYLDGVPYASVGRGKALLPLAKHVRILAETLRGLEHAHSLLHVDGSRAGIVHRDMTPQNVFVTYDGQIKVVDFGIAKSTDSQVETQAGVLKGKPGYMAPEQVLGRAEARSDVFSVGVMLWEAIAQKRMWAGRGDIEIIGGLMRGQLPVLVAVAPDADEALQRICERALAIEMDARWASAEAFADALDEWLDGRRGTSVREVGAAVSAVFTKRRGETRARIEAALAEASADRVAQLPQLGMASEVLSGSGSIMASPLPRSSSVSSTLVHGASMSTPPPSTATAEPRRSMWIIGVVALFAAAAAGGAVALRLRGGDKADTANAATALMRAQATTNASAAASDASASPRNPQPPVAASAAPPAAPPAALAPTAAATAKTSNAKPPRGGGAAKAEAPPADCSPPFYFDGPKKIFKPACL